MSVLMPSQGNSTSSVMNLLLSSWRTLGYVGQQKQPLGAERLMSTATFGGKGFKESTGVSGERPMGAASFRQQCTQASSPGGRWLDLPPRPLARFYWGGGGFNIKDGVSLKLFPMWTKQLSAL